MPAEISEERVAALRAFVDQSSGLNPANAKELFDALTAAHDRSAGLEAKLAFAQKAYAAELATRQAAEQEVERLNARVQALWAERGQILTDAGSDEFGLIKRAEAAEAALTAAQDRSAGLEADLAESRDREVSARADYDAAEARAQAAEAASARMAEVVEAARDLVARPGGLVNRGVGVGLVVVEKADKSDAHYRLCTAIERLDRAALSPPGDTKGEGR